MRQIKLPEVTPGMILGHNILNSNGNILLASGTILTEEYIRKLQYLNIHRVIINDANYTDVQIPESIMLETQQKALTILTTTMERINKGKCFSIEGVYHLASDIVEELISQPSVSIHLTGIATHDDYTLAHSLNCAVYSTLLAKYCDFTIPQIKIITCGALLHDLGKIEIDKKIINKPSKLTDKEFAIIKKHPARGFNLLLEKRWEISTLVAHMAWQHHEKFDGSGYPRGLKGDKILTYARLLTITDVYEALTGDRPYRKAMNPKDAYDIIKSGLGTSFDEKFATIFLSKLAIYSPGMEVLLNTGERAIVISVPEDYPQKPIIRLIASLDGNIYIRPKDINLMENPQISIVAT